MDEQSSKFFEKALDEWFLSNKSIQPKGFKFVSQSKDANFEFIEIWYPNPEGPLEDLSWGCIQSPRLKGQKLCLEKIKIKFMI